MGRQCATLLIGPAFPVLGCRAQQEKANTPTVRLIVETDNGINLDRNDTALSAVRQKIQSTLERANIKIVEGTASKYDGVVRVHFGGCSIGGCSSVLTVTRNGCEIN